MNVLFVSHSANLSGAPLSCFHLMSRLGPGYKAFFVSPSEGPLLEQVKSAGIPHSLINRKGFLGLSYIASFKRLMTLQKIDIVHLNTLTPFSKYAAIAAFLLGIPSLWFVRENPLISRSRRLARWAKILATKVIFVDNMTRQQTFGRNEHGKVETIYNGTDLSVFTPGSSSFLREQFNLNDEDIALGYIGMITDRKGVEHLVEAFAAIHRQNPQTRLFIIGGHADQDEGYYRRVLQMVEDTGLKDFVHLTGMLSDVRPALNALDVVVLPSLEERCSRTLIEALACAKPCVATAVGGTPEIVVDGENGFLVPPQSPSLLAEACLKLLGDPALRKRMGAAGRKRAEELFDIQANVRRIEAIYMKVAGK